MENVAFDRTVKMYDEPHAPDTLDRMAASGSGHRGKFLTPAHQDSYRLQMQVMRDLKVQNVLEVGPGEAFIANYMRTLGVRYDTLDISQHSNPTILGKLEDLDAHKYASKTRGFGRP